MWMEDALETKLKRYTPISRIPQISLLADVSEAFRILMYGPRRSEEPSQARPGAINLKAWWCTEGKNRQLAEPSILVIAAI